MLNIKDTVVSKVTLTKNLVSDQTNTNLTFALGSPVFSAEGHGISTNTSVIVIVHAGGFSDQSMSAEMVWSGPTASPNEEIGTVCRYQTNEATGETAYYYARCDGGTAKLSVVQGGAFANLATGAYDLAANTVVTVTVSCLGNAISATFNTAAGSPANVSLASTNTAIQSGGMMAYRGLSTAFWCKSFTARQL